VSYLLTIGKTGKLEDMAVCGSRSYFSDEICGTADITFVCHCAET